SLPPAAVARTRRAAGVGVVVPATQQVTRMQRGDAAARALVAGVPPGVMTLFPDGFGAATAAVVDPAPRTIVLSPHLAEALGAGAGGAGTVSTPRGLGRLTVAGVLPRGPLSSVNGGDLALAGLAETQRVFARPGKVDRLYVTAVGGASVDALHAALRRAL